MRRALPALLLVLLPLAGCLGSEDPGAGAPATASPAPVDVSLEHDFATGQGTQTFVVPEHARSLRVAASIAGCAQTQDNLRIVVRDPAGATVLDVRREGSNLGVGVVGTCASDDREGVQATPGTWTVEFVGQGVGTGAVTVEN